jgi:hypothetical protein
MGGAPPGQEVEREPRPTGDREPTMPTSDPHPPGEDRSGGGRPSARSRRGRAVVAGTSLAGLAIVLAVLLLVPRCSRAVQDNGSAVDAPPVDEQAVPQGDRP